MPDSFYVCLFCGFAKADTYKSTESLYDKSKPISDTIYPKSVRLVTEGPTVFKKGNLYYLFYSANEFRSPDYGVGFATSESPSGSWKKSDQNPVISKNLLKINGTGHGDFFTDKKGNLQYVFHTHHSNTKVSPRATALVEVKLVKAISGGDQVLIDPSSFRFLTIENR